MNDEIKPPVFEVLSFLPKDFFKKEVNEEFTLLVMKSVLGVDKWEKGNPNKNEPDYLFNGYPFEFTLASDKCKNRKKDNFINRLRTVSYTSENVEDDIICYIEQQIEDKAKKQYSTPSVNLCVLCLVERFDWISDEYGSYTHFMIDHKREQFFNKIKAKYIDAKRFNDIFLIFPDMTATWWLWSVSSNEKFSLQVTPQMIEREKYPYFIEKRLCQQLVKEGLLTERFSLIEAGI